MGLLRQETHRKCSLLLKKQSMAWCVEVCSTDKSYFVKKRGKIFKDNADWEIDFLIYQSDFEEEWESADSNSVSEISSSSAMHDDSDYGEETSATKNSKRKKPTAKNKQGRQSSQPSNSSAVSLMRNSNKNTDKANSSRIQNWKTTKMLTEKQLGDVMMKLDGKCPTCWNFVSQRLSQQHVMKHIKTHRKHMFLVYIELISAVPLQRM